MARTDTLEILNGLIEKLDPVGQMTPGIPIKANDWNMIVDSVRKVATLVVAREKTTAEYLDDRFAPVNHNHNGQATLEWFEPATRKLLEDASQGAVDVRAAMTKLNGDVTALRGDIASLRTAIDLVRGDLDGLRDADSARARSLDRIGTRIQTISTTADKFGDLSGRIDGIRKGLQDALDFKASLQDETGEIINAADLKKRVGSLESLRENMTLASGQIVRMKDFESALARLEENTVKEADLDEAVANRVADGSILDKAGIVSSVKESIFSDLEKRFGEVMVTTTGIHDSVSLLDARMVAQESSLPKLSMRIESAESSLKTLSGLSETVTAHEKTLHDHTTRLTAHEMALSAVPLIDNRVGSLEKSTAAIAPLASRVTSAEIRLTAAEKLSAKTDSLGVTIDSVSKRVSAVEIKGAEIDKLKSSVSNLESFAGGASKRFEIYDAELLTVNDMGARLSVVEKDATTFTIWKGATDLRIEGLIKDRKNTPITGTPVFKPADTNIGLVR
jgi:SMC interacting uncharacterized protein involved in chromosome segregation